MSTIKLSTRPTKQHSQKLDNIHLQAAFQVYNEKYWDGKLDEIPIKFSKKDISKTGYGVYIVYEDGERSIHIAPYLKNHQVIAFQTVLHEMVHHAIGPRLGHKRKFWNEIKRIAALGAYDGLL